MDLGAVVAWPLAVDARHWSSNIWPDTGGMMSREGAQQSTGEAQEVAYTDLLNEEDRTLPDGIEDVPIADDEAPAYTRHHMEAWLLLHNRQTNRFKRFMGIVNDDGQGSAGTSKLIHPMSSLNLNVQLASAFCVIYTGVVTPAVLAFEEPQQCGPLQFTFYADLVCASECGGAP